MMVAPGCGDDGGSGQSSGSTGEVTGSTGTPTTGSPTTEDPPATSSSSGDPTTADSTGADSTTGEPADIDVDLQFAVRVGEDDAACGQSYAGIGASDTTIEFLDIRFFVSNVRLVDDGGNEVPLEMPDDGEWQLEGSALLDFEDGSGGCSEGTTAVTNTVVSGTVPDGTYTGVRFDLGLPFEQNHLAVDTADPPLNTTAMFWNWAAGYKFVRIDIQNENAAPDNRWNFHLGSQGCDNNDGGPTVPPKAECGRPGRPAIAIDGFDPVTGTIVLDAAAIYTGVDITTNTAMTPPGCQSFMPDVAECEDLYPNLGLDWATGDCANGCADQAIFSGE
ncbi:MAG: metallo-mystery pair system four-Cys motif protein [Deltaproteobacteria bacterium]|nr:metallo-mystery pair system four-Cys motif protein [Deltaproteobacteria bacterium]